MNRITTNVSKIRLIIRFKYLFLLTTIFAVGSFILTNNRGIDIILIDNDSASASSWASHRYEINSNERYTINTEGCSIPYLKPMDESILDLVKYPSNLKPCPNSTYTLLGNNRKKIWVKYENIHYYNITKKEEFICCYYAFYRPSLIEDIRSHNNDKRVKYDECVKFKDSIEVKNEFVKVTCFANTKIVYENFFLYAPEKSFIAHEKEGEIPKNKNGYNILVLGIDALSRLNFHRTMPKTVKYLEEKGAVEFVGYNKVGDNTFPNLIPMLLGFKDTELKNTCWTYKHANFDNCPFIWEWFKQVGYFTAFGEDSSSLGTFNYLRTGFTNTPTDYYIHTFMHEAEKFAGNNKDFNSYLCKNEKYFYKVLLEYIEDITTTLKYKKLFGFFWEISMSHDYLNYPMVMDNDYVKTLRQLEASGYLENTIMIFVSDHGIRWGEIRSTKQGRLEERLPFLYILTPPSFRENYTEAYNNFKTNSKRLTTPFDLHATLFDLLDLNKVKNGVISLRSTKNYANDRSISLFLPIPNNRTCHIAGIDDHWCTCLKGVPLQNDDPRAVKSAVTLVNMLNYMLKDYPQCANLSLTKILDVTQIEVGKPDKNEISWVEFLVVVKTDPGGGIFEATLRRYDDYSWALAGTASRLNLYGDQSRCIDQSQLKLYCYCS